MEGVPGVCHEGEGSSAIETVVVSNVNGEKFASNKLLVCSVVTRTFSFGRQSSRG
jgi:hypothetical protein